MSGPDETRARALAIASAEAPFLAEAIARWPDLADAFTASGADVAFQLASRTDDAVRPPMVGLRQRRHRVALAVALADISGEWPLERVMRALSDEADAAATFALQTAMAEVADDPSTDGFSILALGKLGSRELNYSSDIDPILLYDPERLARVRRREPDDVALRIARRWVALLTERTADGYVHRVDLRLRPTPEITPIAIPIAGALAYYESQARAWEQAAFIRARACAGDLALGEGFLRELQPFVWRRSVDFGQLRRITAMARDVREHSGSTRQVGPGWNLKKGQGGIREVEFAMQALQLIHGGRDPSLRAPATLDAIAALVKAGHVSDDDGADLSDSYRLLRTVEHRLQMYGDRQTHSLPENATEAASVAALCRMPDFGALVASLDSHAQRVSRVFVAVVGAGGDGAGEVVAMPADGEELVEALSARDFAEPQSAARAIGAWRSGKMRVLRSAAALDALERVLPTLIDGVAAAGSPDLAITRLDAMFAAMPSALTLFELLRARPALIATLIDVAVHAPPLASELAAQPQLIEALIDARAFEFPDAAALRTAMTRHAGEGFERRLDSVRRVVAEQRFALAVRILSGGADLIGVGRGYARIAEAAIEVLIDATVAEFERAHGRVDGGELVVLALGRLGSGLLTHASDLDLVFLFTAPDLHAESDGARPLGATAYFNRLGQRVVAALSVPTAAGRLYEVDTRLRPEGSKGPLVVWSNAFERYQVEQAWLWEHLALTRARAIYGSAEARETVAAVVAGALAKPRDPREVRADAAAMRAEMASHKPGLGPLDVKHLDGGLIDAEFAGQLTQLLNSSAPEPDFLRAVAEQIARGEAPAEVLPAIERLTATLVAARLVAPGGDVALSASRKLLAQTLGVECWDALLVEIDGAKAVVARWWEKVRAG